MYMLLEGVAMSKSAMRLAFEHWHGFEVCDEMDIQTSVAWDNWKVAWKSAMEFANRQQKINEDAKVPNK